ncbi:hypothetical protein B0H19DRAFT_416587 [Mycena capillaripes]|nr:hypothetical protein B0H19DRAFT_416587 [Mycena capillaripes]
MKPKNPSAAPSNGSMPERIPPVKSVKREFLPIKAWYLGRKFFDEPYNLVWDPSGKMTLRSGNDPSVQAKHSEEIDINWVAQSVSFVGPEELYSDKAFILETFEKFPDKKTGHQKPFGTNYSAYSKLGAKHAEGQLMIKFDSASLAWEDATYGHFIDWLKARVDKREALRGRAGDARWDTRKRVGLLADAAEAHIKREHADAANDNARAKKSAVSGLAALYTWSPPASIATANTAKGTTRSQRLGSPSTPLVESPTRPGPRDSQRWILGLLPHRLRLRTLQRVRRVLSASAAPAPPWSNHRRSPDPRDSPRSMLGLLPQRLRLRILRRLRRVLSAWAAPAPP